jgi:hypothetical protein
LIWNLLYRESPLRASAPALAGVSGLSGWYAMC